MKYGDTVCVTDGPIVVTRCAGRCDSYDNGEMKLIGEGDSEDEVIIYNLIY